jgi:hypothetical protein
VVEETVVKQEEYFKLEEALNEGVQEVDEDDEVFYSFDDDVVNIPYTGAMYNPFNDVGGSNIDSNLDELYYIQDDVQDHSNQYM